MISNIDVAATTGGNTDMLLSSLASIDIVRVIRSASDLHVPPSRGIRTARNGMAVGIVHAALLSYAKTCTCQCHVVDNCHQGCGRGSVLTYLGDDTQSILPWPNRILDAFSSLTTSETIVFLACHRDNKFD